MTRTPSIIVAAAACALAWQGDFTAPANDYAIRAATSTGRQAAWIGDLGGYAIASLGDVDEQGHKCGIVINDRDVRGDISVPGGFFRIGDSAQWGNGTLLTVDDAGQRVILNKPLVMQSPDGTWWKIAIGDDGKIQTKPTTMEGR